MRLTSVALLSLATSLAGSLAVSSPLGAQRSRDAVQPPRPPRAARPVAPRPGELSGTVSPRAIGRPAPTPTPIGGLQTRPLNAPQPVDAMVINRGRDRNDDRGRDRYRDGYRDGYRDRTPGYRDVYQRGRPSPRVYGYPVYRLGVADAPLPRGGVIYYDDRIETRSGGPQWFPTVDKPRWRRDPSVRPVQAWIDLLVNDVVCDGYGSCIERESRARAPWVAVCRCYVFTDAIGRRWEIE